ncbi:MAG: ATP-binding cassette domain-containing protein [Proteobacteria bacterium]|nr:ATP-binding cassette domain-containing protein [Pseudomonadota bacterium]
MTTAEDVAIRFENVSKIYRLHGSQKDQLIEALQLYRYGLKPRTPPKEFSALAGIDWKVLKGQRVGIVGRNGAGKTTLLKLICGNFAPTSGNVDIFGRVQALMNVGIGFHPDFTGRENVNSSLHYNGLSRAEHQAAVEGIIDFCELGEFIDQPFKTYSLGMQARLMFGTATAIRPEILIVDEVLGAGDAYFVAKSKRRVDKLISQGCTMLLVSHAMGQILELCDRAIWLDQGRIRMEGDAFLVVKAYEEYLHGTVSKLGSERLASAQTPSPEIAPSRAEVPTSEGTAAASTGSTRSASTPSFDREALRIGPESMHVPYFVPHAAVPQFPDPAPPGFRYLAPGGLSRWAENVPLKIVGVDMQTEGGSTNKFVCLRPARFVIDIEVEQAGSYNCCYGVAIHDHMGVCVSRIYSSPDLFSGTPGTRRQVALILNPCQIGPGEYTVGISVTEHVGIERLNDGRRFDLLSRSFNLEVVLPDSLGAASAAFLHSAEWSYQDGSVR